MGSSGTQPMRQKFCMAVVTISPLASYEHCLLDPLIPAAHQEQEGKIFWAKLLHDLPPLAPTKGSCELES